MIAVPFEYAAPQTLDAAFELLAGRSDAKVLGGGTVLVPLMGLGDMTPSLVIDLRRLPLGGIKPGPEGLSIGAAASYTAIETNEAVRAKAPLLAFVCRQITGGMQITNQGTAGGSACYANPASDIPACLLALGAQMRVGSITGTRMVLAKDFFIGAFTTALQNGEMLIEIVVPDQRKWTRFGYVKQKHATSSWPIVTAASCLNETGSVRVAVGGAAHRPYVFELARSRSETPAIVAENCGRRARELLAEPWGDVLAPASYRQRIVSSVVVRAVKQALGEGAA